MASIHTYADALKLYEKLKPWRGGDKNVRPLDTDRRVHYREVRMGSEQELIFKFHNTDCLIYYPDGRVWLNHGGWQSKTTGEFFARFKPVDIGVALRPNSRYHAMIVTDYGYATGYWHGPNRSFQFDRSVTIKRNDDGGWKPLPGETVPFRRHTVDTKALNKVMAEEGFDEFVTWFKAVRATGGIKEPEGYGWGRKKSNWPRNLRPRQIVERIQESKDRWLEVYEDQGPRLLDTLRQHIAIEHGCIKVEEFECLPYKQAILAQSSEQRLS